MATRRRYTKAEKATAIIAAEVSSIPAAAAAVGVPESTLRYWMDNPKFAELRAKTREDAAEGFRVLMHAAQARLFDLVATMEPRDLTILLGVSADKSQLLSGEATSRSESRALTEGLSDHEREQLAAAIDQVFAEARAGSPEG